MNIRNNFKFLRRHLICLVSFNKMIKLRVHRTEIPSLKLTINQRFTLLPKKIHMGNVEHFLQLKITKIPTRNLT